MKLLSLITLFSIFSITISASDIVGVLNNKNTKEPIEFANVFLLSQVDSTFIDGNITDESGKFIFTDIKSGNYILKTSFIGYQDLYEDIRLSDERNLDIGIISMIENNTLSEVIITSKNTPFKIGKNGALITSVSTTLLSSIGTANDVIQRMPGVIYSEDKISVFGKGDPIIYVNNRRLHDNQELERIESSEISTIELITNPSAKYNAEGRAVLIINTKNKQNGVSAQITMRLRKGNNWGDNENINISYSKDKLNFFTSYYCMYGKMKTKEDNHIAIDEDVWVHDIYSPYKFRNNIQQAFAGMDWNINEKSIIGIQYQYYTLSSTNKIDMSGSSYFNSNIYDEYSANSTMKEKPNRHLLNVFYNGSYGKFTLQTNLDYIKNHGQRDQKTEEYSKIENRTVNVLSQSDYNLYAGKIVTGYTNNIGLIEAGGEYNKIEGDGYLLNPEGYTKNNIYTTSEQKTATFINFSGKIKEFSISAGLRYEHTVEKSTKDSTKVTNTDSKYSILYPSMSVSRKINNVRLIFEATKRVQRPNFSDLNGNTVYQNRFVFQSGNPYLKKVDIYDVNMKAIYKMFYLNLGYVYKKNPIAFYNEQENSTESVSLSIANYPKYQEINALLSFRHTIAFWNPNYSIGVRKPFFSASYLSSTKDYNSTDILIRSYNDFTLPNEIVLSLNFSYQSNNYYYILERNNNKYINIGVRKSFCDKRLILNLEMQDVFNWSKEKILMEINNVYFDQYKKRETRFVMFSLTYKLNNLNKKYKGKSSVNDDINRL